MHHHHEVLDHWESAIKVGRIDHPTFILHVDEHHDMLSEQRPIQFGNFLYFVMLKWPACRVHWLAKAPIDYPDMCGQQAVWPARQPSAGSATMTLQARVPHSVTLDVMDSGQGRCLVDTG